MSDHCDIVGCDGSCDPVVFGGDDTGEQLFGLDD